MSTNRATLVRSLPRRGYDVVLWVRWHRLIVQQPVQQWSAAEAVVRGRERHGLTPEKEREGLKAPLLSQPVRQRGGSAELRGLIVSLAKTDCLMGKRSDLWELRPFYPPLERPPYETPIQLFSLRSRHHRPSGRATFWMPKRRQEASSVDRNLEPPGLFNDELSLLHQPAGLETCDSTQDVRGDRYMQRLVLLQRPCQLAFVERVGRFRMCMRRSKRQREKVVSIGVMDCPK